MPHYRRVLSRLASYAALVNSGMLEGSELTREGITTVDEAYDALSTGIITAGEFSEIVGEPGGWISRRHVIGGQRRRGVLSRRALSVTRRPPGDCTGHPDPTHHDELRRLSFRL